MLGYNNHNVDIDNFRQQIFFLKSITIPTAARKRWNTELKKQHRKVVSGYLSILSSRKTLVQDQI